MGNSINSKSSESIVEGSSNSSGDRSGSHSNNPKPISAQVLPSHSIAVTANNRNFHIDIGHHPAPNTTQQQVILAFSFPIALIVAHEMLNDCALWVESDGRETLKMCANVCVRTRQIEWASVSLTTIHTQVAVCLAALPYICLLADWLVRTHSERVACVAVCSGGSRGCVVTFRSAYSLLYSIP